MGRLMRAKHQLYAKIVVNETFISCADVIIIFFFRSFFVASHSRNPIYGLAKSSKLCARVGKAYVYLIFILCVIRFFLFFSPVCFILLSFATIHSPRLYFSLAHRLFAPTKICENNQINRITMRTRSGCHNIEINFPKILPTVRPARLERKQRRRKNWIFPSREHEFKSFQISTVDSLRILFHCCRHDSFNLLIIIVYRLL